MKRIHMTVSGRVQGVFYRDTVRRKAYEIGVKGYVRNLSNGDVEIIAEGNDNQLRELVEFCKNDPGYSKVGEVKVKEEKVSGEFSEFEVRR